MPRRLALFIGSSVYDDPTLTRLKSPTADVRALASVLRDPAIGEFDEVVELIDEKESIVRRAIADFFSRRHPEDLLVLYFSGHGVKDDRGRLYLAVRDTVYDRLSATAIASGFVVEHMDECRSKRQILILDCCNSGAFARGMKGDPTAMTADTFAGNGYGRVVLTASDSTQYALEGDRVIERAELSLFTHHLLEGLVTGEASEDEVITLDALYDYAYGRIVSATPGQTPRKWVYSQQGTLVIAHNPRRSDALPITLPEDVRARLRDTRAQARVEGVRELGRLLASGEPTRAVAARSVLDRLASTDRSRHVRELAASLVAPKPAAETAAQPPQPALQQPTTGAHATGQRAAPLAGSIDVDRIVQGLRQLEVPSAKRISESLDGLPVASIVSRLTPRGAWVAAWALSLALAGMITGMMRVVQWNVASRFVAAAIEVAILAPVLYVVLRQITGYVSLRNWFIAIGVAVLLRWEIPMAGSANVLAIQSSAAIGKGIFDGLVFGVALSWAMQRRGFVRVVWICSLIVGWSVAYLWFISAMKAFLQSLMVSPAMPSALIGGVAGLLVGGATSLALPLFAPAASPAAASSAAKPAGPALP